MLFLLSMCARNLQFQRSKKSIPSNAGASMQISLTHLCVWKIGLKFRNFRKQIRFFQNFQIQLKRNLKDSQVNTICDSQLSQEDFFLEADGCLRISAWWVMFPELSIFDRILQVDENLLDGYFELNDSFLGSLIWNKPLEICLFEEQTYYRQFFFIFAQRSVNTYSPCLPSLFPINCYPVRSVVLYLLFQF